MSEFSVGDVVEVVKAEFTFGDYQNGDLARVIERLPGSEVVVQWIKRTPEPYAIPDAPVTLLFDREIRLAQDTSVIAEDGA